MIVWGTLQFERVWPFWLTLLIAVFLVLLWLLRRKTQFPDMRLITATVPANGWFERAPVGLGAVLLILLTLVLAGPSVVRIETIDQRARDFLIIVDTSRSMRHDTQVPRDEFNLNFQRRIGAFATRVDDPRTMPYVARYELARESLLGFLADRTAEDRVGLIYFNDDAYTVAALTTNISFVIQQLAAMDDYVNWGTNIAVAMDTGLNLLERYPEQNKRTVILLTDAETRFTEELEHQLARLANDRLSFYLLWITTDENKNTQDEVSAFLHLARSVGTVFTIKSLDSDSLQRAFSAIGRMEGYTYQENRRQAFELSPPLWRAARLFFLLWLTLMATLFHPAVNRQEFEVSKA